jgi:hypothetical protein
MKGPTGYDYEEDGVLYRVFYIHKSKIKGIKVMARTGNRMVIEYGRTPNEAAKKAKKLLLTPSTK